MLMPEKSMEFKWVEQTAYSKIGEGVINRGSDHISFHVNTPHEPVDQNPIMIFPGFTDGIEGTRRLANAHSELGKTAITFDYPRGNNIEYTDDLEGHKVASGLIVLGAYRSIDEGAQEIDAEGHSEGGANASRACLEHPEQFRSLAVIASGGLIGGDSFAKLTARAAKNPKLFARLSAEMFRSPAYNWQLSRSITRYVWQNPVKARREAVRIAAADIRHRFPVLSRCKNIPNGALQFAADELFPLHLVDRSTDGGDIFDLYEIYPHKDATHDTPQRHPRTTALILQDMHARLKQMADSQRQAA